MNDLCTCGGLTDTCDGCPDCLGLGCVQRGTRVRAPYAPTCPICLQAHHERAGCRAPMSITHAIGCVCADCSAAYEREALDTRG